MNSILTYIFETYCSGNQSILQSRPKSWPYKYSKNCGPKLLTSLSISIADRNVIHTIISNDRTYDGEKGLFSHPPFYFHSKPKRMSICQFRIYFSAIPPCYSFFFARQRQRGLLFIDIAWETRVWMEAFHHNNVIWCLCPCVLSSTCGRLPLALAMAFRQIIMPAKICFISMLFAMVLSVILDGYLIFYSW